MADQLKWFKLWTSICSDDDFEPTPEGMHRLYAFSRLGAFLALHGEKGVCDVRLDSLLNLTNCPDIVTVVNLLSVKNVVLEEGSNCHGKITVSYKKWEKYQKDSTAYERKKNERKRKNVTVQEERRGDKIKIKIKPPVVPLGDVDVVMDFLNQKTGKRFAVRVASGKLTSGALLISDRLKDGFSVQDCKTVIANRVLAWKSDPKMSEFLRPDTLFKKSNFEKYHGGLNWEVELPKSGEGVSFDGLSRV